MHYVGKLGALVPIATFAGHSERFTEAVLVDHTSGSVHTGLSIAQLGAGGSLSPHLHAYEVGFYILSGQAIVAINGETYRLVPGDFGCIKVGTLHAWRNVGSEPVRWLRMAAPQPKPIGTERDTFFQKDGALPAGDPDAAATLDSAGPRGNLLGHFDESQIPPGDEGRMMSAGLKGVFLKWLIDEKFGAVHHRLLFIEYLPGVGIDRHDHTYEEAYFILSGEVEAVLDGTRYLARPGDVLWTSTGCIHTFKNIGTQPVRWLETFAPQPPRENVFRFFAEWEQKAKELEG
jgi:mannose-6-phosphate isomerase-like protein (cupin superfamily)